MEPTEQEVTDILIAAMNKISDPEQHTKGVVARNVLGTEVNTKSPDAVCWCALGALEAVSPNIALYFIAEQRLEKYALEGGCFRIINTNDRLGHEAVMKMYKAAIENKGE